MFQILTIMSNNLLIKITDNEKEMFAKGRTCVNLFTQLHCCRQFGRTYTGVIMFSNFIDYWRSFNIIKFLVCLGIINYYY